MCILLVILPFFSSHLFSSFFWPVRNGRLAAEIGQWWRCIILNSQGGKGTESADEGVIRNRRDIMYIYGTYSARYVLIYLVADHVYYITT